MKALGLTPRDALATKSPAYKKLGLDKRAVSGDELLALMIQEPRLLRRPLVVVDGKPVIGFDKENLARAEIDRLPKSVFADTFQLRQGDWETR